MATLPDTPGVASPFAGVHAATMLIAGGANFPDAPPWAGGTKVWHDTILATSSHDRWRVVGRLPRPLAYGVSASIEDGLLCAGGSDATQHHPDVFVLSLGEDGPRTRPLASLPTPLAHACGALVGRSVFIAGGSTTPDATSATNTFLRLDLDDLAAGWQRLPPWPGPPRLLAVAAAAAPEFVLLGGVDLSADAAGRPLRRYLSDAYGWSPMSGWRRLPDLPRPCAAAPSPAPVLPDGTILLLGGDDGSQVGVSPQHHQGFSSEILALARDRQRWWVAGSGPAPRASLRRLSSATASSGSSAAMSGRGCVRRRCGANSWPCHER
ncbi:MAG: galactose oxidase [Planctomycetes bacterium]|nr:galactose oxidase [Planctomycetota bacterium]